MRSLKKMEPEPKTPSIEAMILIGTIAFTIIIMLGIMCPTEANAYYVQSLA